MAFNIGLSGLRASQVDLDVTGNNIANASTVGFKGSKAQFGDLYSSGFLSSGNINIGGGVKVQDVKQSFGQGNISGTQNGLDMAIDGDGFFILNDGGEIQYSRAGQFGVDRNGYVTNNQGMRVQGFQADEDGNLSGIRGDLQIDTDNLAPRRTTNFVSELNLDSREPVLEVSGTRIQTTGGPVTSDQNYTINYPDGTTRNVLIESGFSARETAERFNEQRGVGASARTTLDVPLTDIQPGYSVNLQGTQFEIPASLADGAEAAEWLRDAINDSPLNTINATESGGSLRLIDSRGNDVTTIVEDGTGTEQFNETRVGAVSITLERDVSISPDNSGILAGSTSEAFRTNTFNPDDQRTYNHATSSTIYDSLGNPHTMTQFFVKEPVSGGDSVWAMYVQIDGRDVGDPPDTNGEPSRARFDMQFNQDGSLASIDGNPSGEVLISNWTPLDENGQPNGADGPRLVAEGAQIPIADPPISSNFVINVAETTQYGAEFGVNDQQQNGYTTGRLSGLDVSGEGIIFARYTNGQSQSLGQVALATFANNDGLTPVGDTSWVETFESGQPIVGAPDTGTLGSITASSVEESNVDLSAELVNLIIAQRNYQANAKTIETSDAVTQTIINLR
ncbi:flagellar hook protein FlgE [Marinobacter daqiaonensis]|uniref:Flagellar hook protein FlgE n=1 Tax=Marinobacter daqiaonensis TaxID=650891 RepID=A0A1I6GKR7_9GAMM|nr:flagellar hook protein FlgE [Marinobacter daqiaonensis]SFR42802.1 flagellar hook protein FlgE [Marinobacter daqiaonensis]